MNDFAKVGRFEITRKLGEGSFGPVYLGQQKEDPNTAAVVVKVCASTNGEIRRLFSQGAEAWHRLQHGNISQILAIDKEAGSPYLVEEYLPGGTLADWIDRRPEVPAVRKLPWLSQVASALAQAHGQKSFHGALQPENLFLTAEGHCKVSGFGLAHLARTDPQLAVRDTTLAEAAYQPPEMVRGGDLDHRVDIFSFGVLAYEILTYERPFRGSTLSALVYQILYKAPVALRTLWPECPEPLEKLVGRCLAKDRKDRYQTCEAILADLDALQKEVTGGHWPSLNSPSELIQPVGEERPPRSATGISREPAESKAVGAATIRARVEDLQPPPPPETPKAGPPPKRLPKEAPQPAKEATQPIPIVPSGSSASAEKPAPASARATRRLSTTAPTSGPPSSPPTNPAEDGSEDKTSILDTRRLAPQSSPAPQSPAPQSPAPHSPAPQAAEEKPVQELATTETTARDQTAQLPQIGKTTDPGLVPQSGVPKMDLKDAPKKAEPQPDTAGKTANEKTDLSGAADPVGAPETPAVISQPTATMDDPPPPPAPPRSRSKSPETSSDPVVQPMETELPPVAVLPPVTTPKTAPGVAPVVPPVLPSTGSVSSTGSASSTGADSLSSVGVPPEVPPSLPSTSAKEEPAPALAQEIGQLVADGNLEAAMAQLEKKLQQERGPKAAPNVEPQRPTSRTPAAPPTASPAAPSMASPKSPSAVSAGRSLMENPSPGAETSNSPELQTLSRSSADALPNRAGEPKRASPWKLWVPIAAAVLLMLAVGLGLLLTRGKEEPAKAAIPAPPPPVTSTAGSEDVSPTGQVALGAVPWAEVSEITDLNGYVVQAAGDRYTPTLLDLPPGNYQILLVNEHYPEETQTCAVEVVDGGFSRCEVRFGETNALDYFKQTGWWQ